MYYYPTTNSSCVLQNHTQSNIHRIESIKDPAADVAQNREKRTLFCLVFKPACFSSGIQKHKDYWYAAATMHL
jgi:hypothetical protein